MTVDSQSLSKFDRFLIVAHSLAIASIGLTSTLFLLLLLFAVKLFITSKQQKQIDKAISHCVGLIWAGCAGALGRPFLEAEYEYEYELHNATEEKIEKVVTKSPLILDALPCRTCQYFSWEIAAKFYFEHPCAVHPSNPSPQCPDYRSIGKRSEDDNPTDHPTHLIALHDQNQ
jgi:hypothetical protein